MESGTIDPSEYTDILMGKKHGSSQKIEDPRLKYKKMLEEGLKK